MISMPQATDDALKPKEVGVLPTHEEPFTSEQDNAVFHGIRSAICSLEHDIFGPGWRSGNDKCECVLVCYIDRSRVPPNCSRHSAIKPTPAKSDPATHGNGRLAHSPNSQWSLSEVNHGQPFVRDQVDMTPARIDGHG